MTTKKAKGRGICDYREFLRAQLKDKQFAAGYLTACFEEGPETFLVGMRDVADAHGGLGELAHAAALNREGLYEMLSRKGNPRLTSLAAILDTLGFEVSFCPRKSRKRAA